MQSSNPNRWPYKRGAITEWKKIVPSLGQERINVAFTDLEVFSSKYRVLPKLEDALDMFRMVMPYSVKVVIVAQSPYPGSCPVTGVPYACGPAFLPARGCATTPVTLRNVISELQRNFPLKRADKPPKEVLLDWIDQGVMLLNSSLTLGTGCPRYLEDHSILWQEIMQDILCTICNRIDPIFVLVGKDAWKFEGSVSRNMRVIKVSHPVARKGAPVPWFGSSVFSRISDMMIEKGEMPIRWM